jgi:cytidylate kinase
VIIAIYGKACVGKSTLAAELGKVLSCPVRHCGEAVKQYCHSLGVSPHELGTQEHTAIDRETRASFRGTQESVVIEGGFLDIVLVGCPEVSFVELICNDDGRATRFVSRDGSGVEAFHSRDASDTALKLRLYGESPTVTIPDLTLDTSVLTPSQVLEAITKRFGIVR